MGIGARLLEPLGPVQCVPRRDTKTFGQTFLGNVKALCKQTVVGVLVEVGTKAVDGAAQDQRSRRVEGKIEGEWLEIDHVGGSSQVTDEVIDMLTKCVEILILDSGKLLAKKFS